MLRKVSPIVCLLLIAVAVTAGENRAWLEQLNPVHTEINYEGVVAYQVDDTLGSFRITHSVVDGREYELLEPMNSAGSDLLSRGHSVKCVYPGENLIGFVLGEEDRVGDIERHYELVLGNAERIAGREGIQLSITPRDPYRLGYRLALDRETALPLKSEMLDAHGKAVERFQFTTIEFDTEPMAEDRLSQAHKVHQGKPLSQSRSEEIQQQLAWHPRWVPEGFRLIREPRDEHGDVLSYSDGLSAFSVFVEPVDAGGGTAPGAMRRGASVAYTHLPAGGGHRVTVVGEVPVITARQVAQSVTFAGGQP